MVEEPVRGAASRSVTPDADIISAWQSDFDSLKAGIGTVGKVELTLPTGKTIKAMRLPLVMMMQQGLIPDALSLMVSQFIEGIEGGDPAKLEAAIRQSLEEGDVIANAQRLIGMLNFVCVNCIVTPRFVMEQSEAKPEEGIFWIAQMNFYDKQYVFQWAQGVDQSVQAFLHEQIDAVGAASHGEGVRPTAEQLLASGDASEFLVLMADQSRGVAMGSIRPREDRRDDRSSRAEEQEATNDAGAEAQSGTDMGTSHAAD